MEIVLRGLEKQSKDSKQNKMLSRPKEGQMSTKSNLLAQWKYKALRLTIRQ